MAQDLKHVRAESIRRGRMLVRLRDVLIHVKDGMDDQGDQVVFRSTNDADALRDSIEKLDAFAWEQIVGEQGETCVFEVLAEQRARADRAEKLLADMQAALAAAVGFVEADSPALRSDECLGLVAVKDLRTGELREFDVFAARAILDQAKAA